MFWKPPVTLFDIIEQFTVQEHGQRALRVFTARNETICWGYPVRLPHIYYGHLVLWDSKHVNRCTFFLYLICIFGCLHFNLLLYLPPCCCSTGFACMLWWRCTHKGLNYCFLVGHADDIRSYYVFGFSALYHTLFVTGLQYICHCFVGILNVWYIISYIALFWPTYIIYLKSFFYVFK